MTLSEYINHQSYRISKELLKSQKKHGYKINEFIRADYGNDTYKGFVKDGKIYLNGEHQNAYTPVFLTCHLLLEWAKFNYQPLYYKAMDLIRNHRYVEKIKAVDFYQKEAAKIGLRKGFKEYDHYFKEEAFCSVVGNRGAQFVTESKRKVGKEWLASLAANLRQEKAMKNFMLEELETSHLEELSRHLSAEILIGGINLFPKQNALFALHKFREQIKTYISSNIITWFKDKNFRSRNQIKKLQKKVFPGGESEKQLVGKMVQKICDNKLDFTSSIKLYISAKSRFSVYDTIDGNYMVASIINDASNEIKEDEAKEIFKLIFFRERYVYKSRELEDAINVLYGFLNNGQTKETLDKVEGSFGLGPENPIPVKGLLAAEDYLRRLQTLDGKNISWERMGNFTYKLSEFPMDCYNIFDADEVHVQNLFIYPYHSKNSSKTPEGFLLSKPKL